MDVVLLVLKYIHLHFDNDFGQQVKLFEHVVWTSAMSGASSVSGAGSDISTLYVVSNLAVQGADSGNDNNGDDLCGIPRICCMFNFKST